MTTNFKDMFFKKKAVEIEVAILPCLAQALVGYEQGVDCAKNLLIKRIDSDVMKTKVSYAKYCALKEVRDSRLIVHIPDRITKTTPEFVAGFLSAGLSASERRDIEKHIEKLDVIFVSPNHDRVYEFSTDRILSIISDRNRVIMKRDWEKWMIK